MEGGPGRGFSLPVLRFEYIIVFDHVSKRQSLTLKVVTPEILETTGCPDCFVRRRFVSVQRRPGEGGGV